MAKPRKNFRDRMENTLTTIKSPTFRIGFSNIDMWISSGNYAMNRRWSGRFDKAFLFGRNYVYYGESGSGKSLMAAIAAGNAQKEHGALVVWMDIEHATDDESGKQWLINAGIDPENLIYASMSTLEEIKRTITNMSLDYQKAMEEGETDLMPIVFVVDSWAAALTESQSERTFGKEAGRIVGDMGQKAKQTGDVINSVTHLCAGKPIMVIGVQHIMDNQDGYGRKHKITGGHKAIYYASGCMLLTKKELKDEDLDDTKLLDELKESQTGMSAEAKKKMTNYVGIISVMEILKSRVSKPFERVEIQIPYQTGLDPYSGLFELLQQEGVITVPSSGWYQFTNTNGDVVKFRKKDFRTHADEIMKAADADISVLNVEKADPNLDSIPDEQEETN